MKKFLTIALLIFAALLLASCGVEDEEFDFADTENYNQGGGNNSGSDNGSSGYNNGESQEDDLPAPEQNEDPEDNLPDPVPNDDPTEEPVEDPTTEPDPTTPDPTNTEDPTEPDPTTPDPTTPDPTTPDPTTPDPTTPDPTTPDPTTPDPTTPDPTTPDPTTPDPTTPDPTTPDPTTPDPTDPDPTTPDPTTPQASCQLITSIDWSTLTQNTDYGYYYTSGDPYASIEFMSDPAVGTYDLGSGSNTNYKTCSECVRITKNSNQFFFQKSGTLKITYFDDYYYSLSGTLSGQFIEVTINSDTYESTPVEGGECLEIQNASFDYEYDDGW